MGAPKPATPIDILVVDDDAVMRDLVSDWLEAAGYGVRKAADVPSALAELGRALPALVVTDVFMPGESGVTLISAVRRDHPALPVVAISGHFSAGCGVSAESALAMGAARALAKPIKRCDMIATVTELLKPPV